MLKTEAFEVRATGRYVRVAPRKVRKVADMIRSQPVPIALEMLTYSKCKGATILRKLLDSAVASAQEQNLGDVDKLVISRVTVDKGPNARRWRPRAQGRATRINKFSSHIHLFVADGTR